MVATERDTSVADSVCARAGSEKAVNPARELKILCKLAQRSQREATGYYCGYNFKRQAVGKYVLKATAESLNYVELGLKDKSAGRQWYRICNRLIQDLNHRCTMRTAPEECNLSANQHPHDATAAEFIRSYRTTTFRGRQYVKLLEREMDGSEQRERRGMLPVRKTAVDTESIKKVQIDEIYGYRGMDSRVYYLSPWEFTMFWEILPLPSPKQRPQEGIPLTCWTCLLYTSPSPRDGLLSRMPSSA